MSSETVLAERRSKVKWSLNPRGSLWANDDNKYGQKLMEKMGWSKGKGLGRELQGDKDHISVRFKHDSKGLGFKGKDDEWIKHYEGFESVLATLNSEDNSTVNSKNNSTCNSGGNSDEEGTVMKSGEKKSLEMASKTSRARVHYHKFVRGKDLSRYSSDDIACVLGSKRSRILAKESVIEEKEPLSGVTVIKGGIIQEYFAQKIEALKNQPKMNSQIGEKKDCQDDIDDNPQRPGFGFGPTVCNGADVSLHQGETAEVLVCKKKKKKKKHTVEDSEENLKSGEMGDGVNEMGGTEVDQALPENDVEVLTSKKKKKKKKRKHWECEEVRNGGDVMEEVPDERGQNVNRRKKKKSSNDCEEESSPIEECLLDDGDVSKSRKKKKKEDVLTAVEVGSVECEIKATDEDSPVLIQEDKKKRKKKKKRENTENGEFSTVITVVEESERKVSDDDSTFLKKKTKKRKKDKDRKSHIVDGQSIIHNKASEISCTSNGHDLESKKSKTKKKRNAVEC